MRRSRHRVRASPLAWGLPKFGAGECRPMPSPDALDAAGVGRAVSRSRGVRADLVPQPPSWNRERAEKGLYVDDSRLGASG